MKSPIVSFGNNELLPGEMITNLNPYTNAGYVISPYYYVTTFGRYFSVVNGVFREKMQQVNMDGYVEINVATSAGQKHLLAHRGVLATFAPVPNMYGLQVDHIDGNHSNNHIDNLAWATSSQNNKSAYETGITPPRSRVISDEEIIKIMGLVHEGKSDVEVSSLMLPSRIAPETIRFIRTGKLIYGDILLRLGLEPVVKKEHAVLTESDYAKVLELSAQGLSSVEISEMTGIPGRTVRGIVLRDRRENDTEESQDEEVQQPQLINPVIETETCDNGELIYPINIYTSPLHVILPLYGVTESGRMFSKARGNKWVEMRIGLNPKGKSTIGLVTDHGTKQFFVRRIVLSTFRPRSDMYELEVRSLNGIPSDNRLENLEWISHLDMMKQVDSTNKTPQRAPDEDIIKIVNYAWKGMSDEQISVLMNDKYSSHNVRIIRSGLKTYGPVLESLNLKPFLQHRSGLDLNERTELYDFIESRLRSKGLMDLYVDAGEKFGITSDAVRRIYSQEKTKRV